MISQFLGVPMTDAPYIADFEKSESLFALLVRIDETYAFIAFVFLGKLRSHLGQGLGGSNAQ